MPTPHPGITLIGPPASAGMRLNWTRSILRPIASGDDQALLYAAASAGNTAVMSLLLGNDPGPVPKYHALCRAVTAGKSAAVLLLLGHGATINERDAETGFTALHHAVSNANADMIDLLLQRGAEADLGDHAGNTPLHAAAIMNHLPILSKLLVKAQPACIANHDGNIPLMLAASHGHAEMVRRLASKSDLHHVNHNADSALTLAAAGGHADIVRRLLGKGADAGQVNQSGASAIQLAAEGPSRRAAEPAGKPGPCDRPGRHDPAGSAGACDDAGRAARWRQRPDRPAATRSGAGSGCIQWAHAGIESAHCQWRGGGAQGSIGNTADAGCVARAPGSSEFPARQWGGPETHPI
jgi:hypothetical protein